MTSKKISALTAATTPLAGTEVLPVVQSGATKQVTVANLTAGRAVSAASLALTSTPLAVTSGGTGQSGALVQYGIVYSSATTAMASTAAGTNTQVLIGNASGAPSWTNTPTLTGTNFSGIPNGALSNSSITFGSTAVSLGGTVSALNNVTIGATTATTGKFTDLTYTGTLSNSTVSTKVYNKVASVTGGVSTTVFTFSQSSYAAFFGGTLKLYVVRGGYPAGVYTYEYQLAGATYYALSSWRNSGNQSLLYSNNSVETGFNISAGPTWTWTKSASASNGVITVDITTSHTCSVICVFEGYNSGVSFS